MSDHLHIMHVVLSLDVGGLEHVVLKLIDQSARRGDRVSVLCVNHPGKLADEAERLGAYVLCANKQPGLRLDTVKKIRGMIAADVPSVVHTHQIGALFYAGRAARQAGVPAVVHTEHGKHYENRRKARWLAWWSARAAHRFFCVSADIASAIGRYKIAPSRKVAVVANGIDTFSTATREQGSQIRARLGIPLDAPVIGTVGRLAEVKRQDAMIRGLAKLSAIDGKLPHLLLVGSGPLENDLRRVASEEKVSDRVHFAGYQSDPRPYLRAMDVFTLTSRSEGMPLTVLEAWAAEIPVVTSRVGGLPELIEHDHTGLLYDPADAAALPAALHQVLTDSALAARLAAAGRVHVKTNFDVAVMADVYRREYLALLQPAGAR